MANGIDSVPRDSAAARLACSRAELKALFEPAPVSSAEQGLEGDRPAYPRSWTMKLLTKGAGPGGLAAMAALAFAASPAKAIKLLGYLPIEAIANIVVDRLIKDRRSP